jgi:GNAT superfamily N-acetyltransferase
MPEPIPVILLGRLACDARYQGRGIGKALVRDALVRVLQIAESAGVAAVLVHALDETSRKFWLSCGFVESPLQASTLCLPLGTLRAALG